MLAPSNSRADDGLDWDSQARDWPGSEVSRFVEAGEHRWHVQEFGDPGAPSLLMVHGTGASGHSMQPLAAALGDSLRVVNIDLPGHGFTRPIAGRGDNRALSLAGMAAALGTLLRALGFAPQFAVGHSAGTAIALQMTLDGRIAPERIFGINSALEPIAGDAFLSPIARMLHATPFSARFFSWQARVGGTDNLLRATGSAITPESRRCYAALFGSAVHVGGALAMMANWRLQPLQEALPRIDVPVTLMATEDDPMVPAGVSRRAALRLPRGEHVSLGSGGHLVHETAPASVAGTILARLEQPDRQEAAQ